MSRRYRFALVALACLMFAGCDSLNGVDVTQGGIATRSDAGNTLEQVDGRVAAHYQSEFPTVAEITDKINVTTGGLGSALTYGPARAWLPKDGAATGIKIEFDPETFQPTSVSIDSINADASTVVSAYGERITAIMQAMVALSAEERIRYVESLKAAGTITESLANAIIGAFSPVP